MLNGWFTIVAQAINFLILVGLLQHFLYKPILQAIDAREKGIAAQLASAVAKEATAQKSSDDFQHKNQVFDQERGALLTKATDEAKAERQRLIDNAKKDSDALRASRQVALQTEQRHLDHQILLWTQNQVFTIARKTLADLASPCLEAQMSQVFIARLRALKDPAKAQLGDALKKLPSKAMVRSAVDLPPAQQAEIEKAVKETFGLNDPVQFQFQTVPELVGGVELTSNGQKVAWSIADYLSTLEKSAGELLHMDEKPEPKPDSKPKPAPKPSPPVPAKAEAKPAPQPAAWAAKGGK
jgi:F-type H+-transporting ATPase subunit b